MKKELELYIHIPFCMKKCDYCDFLSAPADEKTQNRYVAALLREIRYYGARCRDREVSTIYIGGGTPSWLMESYMELILKQLLVSFFVREDAEITIECNPGTLTKEKLVKYYRSGINRLSMGLQSTMSDELKELGRVHTYEQFLRNYELAREIGFTNINVDLMSALPYQTAPKYLTSLKRIIALKPEHISAYSLIIEPGTPFYEKYRFDAVKRDAGMPTEFLPSEETEYEITHKTKELLAEAGYKQYEISNYAKPGYECRHNIGYWRRTDYLGMGLGAASLVDNIRYTNIQDLFTYIEESADIVSVPVYGFSANQNEETDRAMQTVIQEADGGIATNLHAAVDVIPRNSQIEEFMFLGLRMMEGVTRTEFKNQFGIEIEAVYGTLLQKLSEEGLIIREAGEIRLTERGNDISNYVMSQFLLS